MRITVIGAIVGLLFALKAQPVYAVEVTWEMTGTVIENTGLEGVFIGDPFQASLTFDGDAALIATQSGGIFEPGARYEYDTTILTVSVIWSALPEVIFESSLDNEFQLLWVRDNSGDGANFGEPPVVDGFSAAIFSPTPAFAGFLFRGSIIDIFDGPGLPLDPDQRLLQQELSRLQFSNEDGAFVSGQILTVQRIIEPAALLSELLNTVAAMNIQAGIGNALDSKLQNILDALGRAQQSGTPAAVQLLSAFISSVDAQRGKALTDTQADQLVSDAQAIMDALN